MRTSQNGDTPLLKTVQKLSHQGRNRILTVPTVTHLGSVHSVQFSSVAQSCPTLCHPMNYSTPGPHAVHGVAKSQTRLSDFPFTFHFHALEKEMATHSSVLAWKIPGKGEPGGLPSMGKHRVGHDWSDVAVAAGSFTRRYFSTVNTAALNNPWLAESVNVEPRIWWKHRYDATTDMEGPHV